MANDFPQAGVEFVVTGTKSLDDLTRKANAADTSVENIVDSVNKLDKSLDGIKSKDVDVKVDTSKIKPAQNEINNLSREQNVDVTADTGQALAAIDQISGQLQALQQLAVINILMEVPNLAENPVFAAISDTETQVDRIAAMTGQEIPNAAGIINNLYSEAWGESRQEIADVIIEMGRLKVANRDFESTARSAFQVAAVTGEEPLDILRSMEQLVANELSPSFTAAGDYITRGFQTGLNQSGDFLDSIIEYSSVFKDNSLSAGAFFEILKTGLEGGAYNTDYLIDGFKEMTNLSREEISRFQSFGEQTDRTRAFGEMGLTDEAGAYSAGQITGDQFAAGVLDGLRAVEDPAKQRELALAIFSPTMVENIGLPNLLAMDLSNSSELPAAWEGVAANAATVLTDNLNGAIEEFTRLIETELITALDEAFDLTARMDIAKQQFQDFIAAIRAGEGVGGAIEIAFGIPGVDTALLNIERVFGNLVIAILEAVAFIQDPTGTTDADKGTRGQIAKFAEGQLAFDLQVANLDEVPALLQQAVDRGVSGDAIGNAVVTAAQEAIAAGDIALAARLTRSIDVASQAPLIVMGREFEAGATPEDIKRFLGLEGAEIDAAIANAFAGRSEGISQQVAGELETIAENARAAFFTAMEGGDIGEALNIAGSLDDPALISRASQAASEMFLAAQEALNNFDFSTANTLANQLQDPTLIAQATELGDFLRGQFDLAMQEGDLFGAKQLATDLADPTLLAAVEGYKNSIKTSADGASRAVNISADDIKTALNREVNDMNTQKPAWRSWADSAILEIDRIAERILYVNEQMMGLNNELQPGTEGSGIGMGGGGMATGGTATGRTLVGEEGAEYITAAQPAGVINAANTSVLIAALDRFMGGMGGGATTVNNYISLNSTLNAQNQAQTDAYGYRVGKTVRGFASS